MDLLLNARFSSAKASLLMAEVVSRKLAPRAGPLVKPVGAASLPQHDSSPERAGARKQALVDYAVAPAHEVYKLPYDLRHNTLQNLPKWEEYPALVKLPKIFLLVGFALPMGTQRRWKSIEEIRECYAIFGKPGIADRWDTDEEFARQRLQGPNPIWIRRAKNIDELIERGLSRENMVRHGIDKLDSKRLFFVDYQPFAQGLTNGPDRFIHPALALFQQQPEGHLMPVGIQLTLDSGKKVFYPPDGTPAWTLAKMFFQSLDIWVHEVVTHYAWTHLYQEKFILATDRHLPWAHPVRRLLAPHFENTLKLNRFGTGQLLAPGKVFESEFGPGAGGVKVAVEWGNANWHFSQLVLDEGVARRGMDELPAYPYRDDGRLHWKAIEQYVGEYLALYYQSDADLTGDFEIGAWHRELFEAMSDRGFPQLTDLATLRQLLTIAIFNVIHHEFVNSPQYEYFGFPPSSPTILVKPMPEDPNLVTAQTVLDTLPDVNRSLRSMLLAYGFSKQYNLLAQHTSRFTDAPAREVALRYSKALQEIEAEVARRNASRKVPYLVSIPSRMNNSISA